MATCVFELLETINITATNDPPSIADVFTNNEY